MKIAGVNIRRDIPLRVRLIVFIAIMSLLLSFATYISLMSNYQLFDLNQQLTQTYFSRFIYISNTNQYLNNIIVDSKNHILTTDEEQKLRYENAIAQNFEQLELSIKRIKTTFVSEADITNIKEFLTEYENYRNINNEILTLSSGLQTDKAMIISTNEDVASYRMLQDILQKLIVRRIEETEKLNADIADQQIRGVVKMVVVIIAALIIILAVGWFIIKDVVESIRLLNNQLALLRKGDIPDNKLVEYSDEVGQISGLVNNLSEGLSRLRNFAIEIGQGKYDTAFTPLGKQDLLGNALLELRDNLSNVTKEDERRKIEDERRNWVTEGLAKFAEILRQSSSNLNEQAAVIIKNTVKYLHANQGGLFIYNDNNPTDPFLELIAAYAYDRHKFLDRQIRLSEGLVGTCALEKQTIYLTEIPENYIKIDSGLGQAQPTHLLIIPLKMEEQIFGVLELASFSPFLQHEIEFTEKLAESIASTLATAKINARTALLLSDSRKQSDELAMQEEKMRLNLEKMRITQDEAALREVELSNMLSAIDNTLVKGEYEPNGNLLSANNRYLETMGYRLHEIKGKNIKMFVPAEELKEFMQTWQTVCSGKAVETIIKRRTKNGDDVWFQISYSPVINSEGKVYKILVLAINITAQKKIETEVKQQASRLEEQEEKNKKLLREAQKQAKELMDKDEKLRRNLDEVQLLHKEISQKAEQQKAEQLQMKHDYEREFESLINTWQQHIYNAQNVSVEKQTLEQNIEQQRQALNQYNQAIEQLNNQITHLSARVSYFEKEKEQQQQNQEQQEQYKESVFDNELDKAYTQWLKNIKK